MKFHQDPNNPGEMICDDCHQALEEINSEWMDLDDEDYLSTYGDNDGEWDEFEGDEDDED